MRRWIGGGLVLLVVGVIAWWRLAGTPLDDGERHGRVRSQRLDVDAFRASLAARLEGARQVVARPLAPAPARVAPPARQSPLQGQGLVSHAGKDLAAPQCTLGPRELCALLDPLVDRCDAGDAPSCVAVGEYLADAKRTGSATTTAATGSTS